jgi:hypothetical protein
MQQSYMPLACENENFFAQLELPICVTQKAPPPIMSLPRGEELAHFHGLDAGFLLQRIWMKLNSAGFCQ